jgi:delta(3,5)-delta(2,4)-dienoyl-CoA isomerase
MQRQTEIAEKVRVPVICALHGFVIGAGVDLASSCDIRISSKDTKFTIKEVDIGIVADLGTMQRFQKIVGNDSFFREISYSGRFFSADEALHQGFLSYVTDTKDQCL